MEVAMGIMMDKKEAISMLEPVALNPQVEVKNLQPIRQVRTARKTLYNIYDLAPYPIEYSRTTATAILLHRLFVPIDSPFSPTVRVIVEWDAWPSSARIAVHLKTGGEELYETTVPKQSKRLFMAVLTDDIDLLLTW